VPLRAALASVFVNTVGSAIAEASLFGAVLPIAGSRVH
jgi:hypothetical protein